MATFDRNCLKEWIGQVDNDKAEFVGSAFVLARIVGFISQQAKVGMVSEAEAEQLLRDVEELAGLLKLGRRYITLARNPTPEMLMLAQINESER